MAEKKLNNLVYFKTFTESDLFKDNKPTKRTEVAKDVLKENINEKWDEDVEIKHTGENTAKSIEELEGELANLKKKSKAHQDKDEAVPEEIKKKERQINFAIRAKKKWKK